MTELITAKTLRKAFNDRQEGRYDVSDSRIAGLQLRVKPMRFGGRCACGCMESRSGMTSDPRSSATRILGVFPLTARGSGRPRHGHNPATFLAATGVSIETQRKIEAERPRPSWRWEKAKQEFLAEVKRSNRPDTHRDYRSKMLPAQLDRFTGGWSTRSPVTRWPPPSRPCTPVALRPWPRAWCGSSSASGAGLQRQSARMRRRSSLVRRRQLLCIRRQAASVR